MKNEVITTQTPLFIPREAQIRISV